MLIWSLIIAASITINVNVTLADEEWNSLAYQTNVNVNHFSTTTADSS